MAQLEQLRKNFDANALEISTLKKKIEQLEVEQHRVGIAIEVISALPVDGEGAASHQNTTLQPATVLSIGTVGTPGKLRKGKPTVKQLILEELAKVSPLTKMDLVSRLVGSGHDANPATIGSTLSKLLDSELEKSGRSRYRLKGETAQGEDPNAVSSATEQEGSLL